MSDDAPPDRSRRARQYFESLWSSFEAARRSSGSTPRRLRIARHRWNLEFASPSLASAFRPAFAHLETGDDDAPDLTVGLWSASATGVAIPSPEWTPGMTTTNARLDAYSDDAITMIRDPYFNLLVGFDGETGRAVYAVDDETRIPGWEVAAPLRFLVNGWFGERGIQMIHAACVARDGRGALLAGPGGSGKSSTALLCLLAGFDYLGDDYCLAKPGAHSEGFSLYNSAKLHAEDLDRFPGLRPHFREAIRDVEGEKPVVFVHDAGAGAIRNGCGLVAIYMPRVSGSAETTIAPLPRATSWHAIAPSTMTQLLGASPHNLSLIGAVASSLPAFRLDLGTNLEDIPGVLAEHLSSLGDSQV